MATSSQIQRSVATFSSSRSAPALLAQAHVVVQAMTGNASFPSPQPPLATVMAAIDDLEVAQTAALARTRGAATVRDDKRAALALELKQLVAYVQGQADANVANGAALIQSAGLAIRKIGVRPPRTFSAKVGPVSGSAKLTAPAAARRASYEWEYSADGGVTWVIIPSTLQARTLVTGLKVGASVQFRYRAVTRTGEANWSQTVTLVVQ